MSLSTFNFNRLRAILYPILVILIGTIVVRYPKNIYNEPEMAPAFSPAIKNSLNQNKPDIILIGNSILYKNVDNKLLNTLLEKSWGHPVNVQFITSAGSYTAWAYLVIKNQILKSKVAHAPVGYFYRKRQLTSPFLDFLGIHTAYMEQLLTEKEPVFMSKLDSRLMRVKIYFHVNSIKKSISLSIRNDWIRTLAFWEYFDQNPINILKNRFKLKFRNPTKNVGLVRKGTQENIPPCDDFKDCVEKSFLPNIISLLGEDQLFFVKIHEKPLFKNVPFAESYSESLANYLDQKGIQQIALNEIEELNDPRLYRSQIYLTEEGQKKNTMALANEIFRILEKEKKGEVWNGRQR